MARFECKTVNAGQNATCCFLQCIFTKIVWGWVFTISSQMLKDPFKPSEKLDNSSANRARTCTSLSGVESIVMAKHHQIRNGKRKCCPQLPHNPIGTFAGSIIILVSLVRKSTQSGFVQLSVLKEIDSCHLVRYLREMDTSLRYWQTTFPKFVHAYGLTRNPKAEPGLQLWPKGSNNLFRSLDLVHWPDLYVFLPRCKSRTGTSVLQIWKAPTSTCI